MTVGVIQSNQINVFAFVTGEYHPVFGKELYIDEEGNDQLLMKFLSNGFLKKCHTMEENVDYQVPGLDPNQLIDPCSHFALLQENARNNMVSIVPFGDHVGDIALPATG
jgi:hypothetical protein